MTMFKSRILVTSLAVAGVASAVALGFAAPHIGSLLNAERQSAVKVGEASVMSPTLVADKKDGAAQPKAQPPQGNGARDVKVEAPYTSVNVNKDRGNVRVTAPHTDVRVDPDRNRVQVRAPYVNLDIRW